MTLPLQRPLTLVKHYLRNRQSNKDTILAKALSKQILERLGELRTQYLGTEPAPNDQSTFLKYWAVEKFLIRDLERVRRLKLHQSQPKRILDLGSGMGYFLYLCRHFGHEVYGLDRHDPEDSFSVMFKQIMAALEIERTDWTIQPFQPLALPDAWPKMDVITAHQIQFNRQGRGDSASVVREDERWTIPEWDAFLKDLQENITSGSATVELRFNQPQSWDHPYSSSLEGYFQSKGADCQGRLVRFEQLD